MNAPRRAAWPRLLMLGVTVTYWVALFVGTHLPKIPKALVKPSDKTLHFGAYLGLGLLVLITWSLFRPLNRRQILTVIGILALYGALDEITQPLVGRHADVLDWLADLAGVAVAVAIVRIVVSVLRQKIRARSAS